MQTAAVLAKTCSLAQGLRDFFSAKDEEVLGIGYAAIAISTEKKRNT